MDPQLAAALRALGPDTGLPEAQALYADRRRLPAPKAVRVHADLAYGPHPRHRLDLYAPARPGPHPVLVWLHGGGFIRGDKRSREAAGYWAAGEGLVAVLPNYRLAPADRWPSGPQDVVAVWQWLQEHAAAFGGDAARTVLAGESAGAAHVAAAVLMRRFQPPGWRPAGAVLLSGPFDARLEGLARPAFGTPTPDPRNDAYIGPAPQDWAAASILAQVDAAPLPLWIGFAERDLLAMQVQAGALFSELVVRHGFAPELHRLPAHNHYSPASSLGSDDDSLAAPLRAFVRRVTGA